MVGIFSLSHVTHLLLLHIVSDSYKVRAEMKKEYFLIVNKPPSEQLDSHRLLDFSDESHTAFHCFP